MEKISEARKPRNSFRVTASENLRNAAYEYCCSAYVKGTSFLTIANKLTKLGVPRHRAKRMARHVIKHGQFMWEGKLTPLKREQHSTARPGED